MVTKKDKLQDILVNLNVRGDEYEKVVKVLEVYAIGLNSSKKKFNIKHLTSDQVDGLLKYFEGEGYSVPIMPVKAPSNVSQTGALNIYNKPHPRGYEKSAKILDDIKGQRLNCGCFQHSRELEWVTVKYCDKHWEKKDKKGN